MKLRSSTVLLLMLLLCSCRDAPQGQELWRIPLHANGGMVQADNSLLFQSDMEMFAVTAEGSKSESWEISDSPANAGSYSMFSGAALRHAGDEYYLGQSQEGRPLLIHKQEPLEILELSDPQSSGKLSLPGMWTMQKMPCGLAGQLLLVDEGGTLIAFDYLGAVLWRFHIGSIYGMGLLGPQRLVVSTMEGFLYCLNRDGSLLWHRRVDSPGLFANDSGVCCIMDSALCCLNDKGELLWQRSLANNALYSFITGHPDADVFYLQDQQRLSCYDMQGERLWQQSYSGGRRERFRMYYPAADGFLFEHRYLFGDESGILGRRQNSPGGMHERIICLDRDGHRIYSFELANVSTTGILPGSGGRLYCSDYLSGELVAITPPAS